MYFLHESVQCQDRAVYCSLQAAEKVTFFMHFKFIDNTNSASYYISETDVQLCYSLELESFTEQIQWQLVSFPVSQCPSNVIWRNHH